MKLRYILSSLIIASLIIINVIVFSIHNIEPDFLKFKSKYQVSDQYLYSKEGKVISQIRMNSYKKNLNWFEVNSFNSYFINNLLIQEDRRFFNHSGFDFLALIRSAFNSIDLFNYKRQGGSTITMQLVKNLFQIKTRTFFGKWTQILTAWKLENYWTKENILEAYLNTSYFHGEIQGLGSASILIFNKSPLYLTQNEQQILLGLLKKPKLSKKIDYLQEKASFATHFHYFRMKNNNLNSQSEIDFELQLKVNSIIQSHISKLKEKNVHDAAVVVLNNKTGSVLSYVGSSGPLLSFAPHVDMAQAKRQMGSTLKPFLYGQALQNNLIDLDSWLLDSPLDITFENGTYSPKNHDQIYHGWVKVGMALGSSLNIPAVKTIQLLGINQFWKTLYNFGFSLTQLPDYYGPSLSLGVLDGSLWELTEAYRKLSESNNDIFNSEVKQKIKWMLSRSQNRSLSFGQDSILSIPDGFAVKTGTSKDMKDNWCIGYNNQFTVGVWVGNSENSSMKNVMGITGAAPIWRETVEYILSRQTKMGLEDDNELISSLNEKKYFEMEANSKVPHLSQTQQIITPAKNSIFAIDPDIPLKNQKIVLQSTGSQKNIIWKKNGKVLNEFKIGLTKGWQKIELFEGSQKKDESVFLVK